MTHGSPVQQTLAVALAVLFAAGCTSEEIVYRDREPFNPPAEEAQGMLGYYDENEKQTTCGNCHVGQQNDWATTRHADAYATLAELPSAQECCFNCHTTNDQGNSVQTAAG